MIVEVSSVVTPNLKAGNSKSHGSTLLYVQRCFVDSLNANCWFGFCTSLLPIYIHTKSVANSNVPLPTDGSRNLAHTRFHSHMSLLHSIRLIACFRVKILGFLVNFQKIRQIKYYFQWSVTFTTYMSR